MKTSLKIIGILLSSFIIISLLNGVIYFLTYLNTNEAEDIGEVYNETYENINSININLTRGNITILSGDENKITYSNVSKKFKVTNKNNKLEIFDSGKYYIPSKIYPKITIYVTDEKKIDEINLVNEYGSTVINSINTISLFAENGYGKLIISNTTSELSKMNLGAGDLEIKSSYLNDLDLESGVGKNDISAIITGNSKIEVGVGELNLNLLGEKESYSLDLENGIGKMTIDNQSLTNYGTGNNKIKIIGGIGNTKITFSS